MQQELHGRRRGVVADEHDGMVGVEREQALMLHLLLGAVEAVEDPGGTAQPRVRGSELERPDLRVRLDGVQGGEQGCGVDAIAHGADMVSVADWPSGSDGCGDGLVPVRVWAATTPGLMSRAYSEMALRYPSLERGTLLPPWCARRASRGLRPRGWPPSVPRRPVGPRCRRCSVRPPGARGPPPVARSSPAGFSRYSSGPRER